MIARMLNLCGLYLGEEDELHAAKPDNPEGFWEHIGFQNINDKLLGLFGGAWDYVPALPDDWLVHPEVVAIREEASALVAEFNRRGKGEWGWKDPRNSITLQFWQQVIPELKVVVALRNPVDVAASLTKRAYASERFGIGLWESYSEALAQRVEPERTLYTHYAAYFHFPEPELERVNAFCGLKPSREAMEAAIATVSPGLRHSEATFGDLLESDANFDAIRLYFDACLKSGPVYEKVMREEAATLATIMRDREVVTLKGQVEANQAEIKARETEIAEAKKNIEQVYAKYNQQIADLHAEHQERILRVREEGNKRANQLQHEVKKTTALRLAAEKETGRLTREIETLRQEIASLLPKAALADQYAFQLRALGASRFLRLWATTAGRMQEGGLPLVARGVAGKLSRKLNAGGTPAPAPAPPPTEALPDPPAAATPTVLEVLGISASPLPKGEWVVRLKKALQFDSYGLALSHDSFQAYTGGIQTVIREEMEAFRRKGVSHVHLCPMEGDPSLAIVSAEGKALGLGEIEAVRGALQTLAVAKTCQSVQIHHLLNWDLGGLGALVDIAPAGRRFFWIHDYYTICEGYNLLRNDRVFCNAPPVDSNSCMVCRYGARRTQHLQQVGGLMRRGGFIFLTPSEKSAEIWRKCYADLADSLKVTPLYELEETDRHNVRQDPGARKLKVAYVGISYPQKGWAGWRQLVETFEGNPNYEFIHLGQRTTALMHTKFPERFERVRSGPERPDAMPEALEREQVDIVYYCPIWPETFSLIAYEADGTGCWTLTIKDSGNVACYVERSGSGRVFADLDGLMAYLADSTEVRRDLAFRRESVPCLSQLSYRTEIVDATYLGS